MTFILGRFFPFLAFLATGYFVSRGSCSLIRFLAPRLMDYYSSALKNDGFSLASSRFAEIVGCSISITFYLSKELSL